MAQGLLAATVFQPRDAHFRVRVRVAATTVERCRGSRCSQRAFVLLAVADLGYFTCVGVSLLALPIYVTGPIGSDKAGAGLAFGSFVAQRPWCARRSPVASPTGSAGVP